VANNALTIEQPLDVSVKDGRDASTIEQRRRRHILRVVAAVVAEEGFTGATMRKIAERAGVSTGMLTYYYKNKRDILTDMMAQIYARLVASLSELLADEQGPERVEAAFQFMLEGSRKGSFPMSFWLAYFSEALRDEEMRATAIQGTDRLRSVFRHAVIAGMKTHELRADLNPEDTADLLMCMWQGVRVEVGLYGIGEERALRAVQQVLALMAKQGS
jgi:AcrR family transcriptional regulator